MANKKLTSSSTNEDILAVYGKEISEGKTVCFAVETPNNGSKTSKNCYFIQKVQIKGLETADGEVSLGLAMRVGASESIIRHVINLPSDKAIVGVYPNAYIKIIRTVGVIKNSEYPQERAVINPTTDEVITRDGHPVFEIHDVMQGVSKPQSRHVDGVAGTMSKVDLVGWLQTNSELDNAQIAKIAQLQESEVDALA